MFLTKKEEKKEEVIKKAVPKAEEKPKETKKEKKEDKKEEPKQRVVVVKELPIQKVRESVAEDGTILHWITIEEALTQFMNQ